MSAYVSESMFLKELVSVRQDMLELSRMNFNLIKSLSQRLDQQQEILKRNLSDNELQRLSTEIDLKNEKLLNSIETKNKRQLATIRAMLDVRQKI